MNTNDNGDWVIDLDCYCGGSHCQGNLYIQPDHIDGQRVFMVSTTDTRGYEQADLWFSPAQIQELIAGLNALYLKYKDN